MKLQATTLNGQMMLGKHKADIPGLKDGDILDSEEVKLVWQCKAVKSSPWKISDDKPSPALFSRQAYILKSQPKKNPRLEKRRSEISQETKDHLDEWFIFKDLMNCVLENDHLGLEDVFKIVKQQGYTIKKQP